ncbi:MAG: competence/damage-inducible protein A, partial [Ectothiorhodospiraceae bacterium]|nr:competence/damage-inducible protein A [Ectothiorhodospiraceae bacterium]
PGFPNMAWPMLEWVLDTQYRALFDSTPPIEHRMLLLDTLESDLIPTMEELLQRFPGVRLASLPSTENRRQIDLGIKGRKEAADAAWAWLLERLREQHRSWRPIEPGA